MTTSIREQIATVMFSKAESTVGVGGRAYRSRQEAFSRAAAPALVMECLRNTPAPDRGGHTRMPTQLEIRFLLLIDDPIPDRAADPILVDLHNRIMGDLSLGGLASEIAPGETRWDLEGDGVAIVSVLYVVKYQTLTRSLTSA
jgi:hypothetical protein